MKVSELVNEIEALVEEAIPNGREYAKQVEPFDAKLATLILAEVEACVKIAEYIAGRRG